MDQSAISGLGNIFSDEILFQTHVYPKTKVSKLDENKVETMFSLMKEILNKAVDRKLDNKEYPNNFIIPHRDLEDTCPICGTNIKRLEISSRHSYYCPKCQPKQN
jgi:formamidopyrimidine-DNA glycosylase